MIPNDDMKDAAEEARLFDLFGSAEDQAAYCQATRAAGLILHADLFRVAAEDRNEDLLGNLMFSWPGGPDLPPYAEWLAARRAAERLLNPAFTANLTPGQLERPPHGNAKRL